MEAGESDPCSWTKCNYISISIEVLCFNFFGFVSFLVVWKWYMWAVKETERLNVNIFNNNSVFPCTSQFTLEKQKEKKNIAKWKRFRINSFLSSNLSRQANKRFATPFYPRRLNLSSAYIQRRNLIVSLKPLVLSALRERASFDQIENWVHESEINLIHNFYFATKINWNAARESQLKW